MITHATLYGKIYWVTYNWDINKYTGVCLIIFSVAGEDLVCNCTNQKLLKLTDQAWSLSLVLPSAQNRPGDQAFFFFDQSSTLNYNFTKLHEIKGQTHYST